VPTFEKSRFSSFRCGLTTKGTVRDTRSGRIGNASRVIEVADLLVYLRARFFSRDVIV
jgi:hypothetical protein